ncbi:hypothetical protein skT53_16680 [Effusibacillus dendaii]|uniref:Uncharacterized protein n=1 Tax=Effusibacillus dendaii TaxID=2743772 RepID=A0A7I8D962_9BACL|nr:hypothetical protein skT53_16680 [Effusibacillus dendaii]
MLVPVSLWFGFVKSNTITQGGCTGLGINIIQNRNSTKQNNGALTVSGGFTGTRISHLINADSDLFDLPAYDANDFTGLQI